MIFLELLLAATLITVLIILICDCRQNCRNQGTMLDSMVIVPPLPYPVHCTICCMHWLKAFGSSRLTQHRIVLMSHSKSLSTSDCILELPATERLIVSIHLVLYSLVYSFSTFCPPPPPPPGRGLLNPPSRSPPFSSPPSPNYDGACPAKI